MLGVVEPRERRRHRRPSGSFGPGVHRRTPLAPLAGLLLEGWQSINAILTRNETLALPMERQGVLLIRLKRFITKSPRHIQSDCDGKTRTRAGVDGRSSMISSNDCRS